MISKENIFCQELKGTVEVLVESKKGKVRNPVSCTKAFECSRTTFCRFVNPLTTRIPLVMEMENAGSIS